MNFASTSLKGSMERDLFDHLYEVASSEWFLERRGLNNEVPFFICPFQPAYSVEMKRVTSQLKSRLRQNGVAVLEVNLFELSIELIEERELLGRTFEMEKSVGKDRLLPALRSLLDPEQHLVPRIAQIASKSKFDVLFLSGVGEVFPFIRSHNVLNNLQSTMKECPTVMFFPGSYQHELATGASLDLFGLLTDDRYYRAYNILTYKVPK